ncbi:hypothetical protein Zm00014a_019664 [Zea mays]|uniref:Uncharacterized protein n=1 Tax=Zea mays TaxID=4577 RepID=A0A3L6G5D9_MAIZE|nr:hypothetical protein Zm00014a_019664 [Zea mays]
MAQGGNKGKKAVSLREKKDAANNAALAALSKEAGEYNSMMNRVETMGPELREYVSQNKHTLGSKMKATIKKLLRKGKPNKKRRTMLHPIVGATLKFHKDDDMPGAV